MTAEKIHAAECLLAEIKRLKIGSIKSAYDMKFKNDFLFQLSNKDPELKEIIDTATFEQDKLLEVTRSKLLTYYNKKLKEIIAEG